jgi:hypothetical protein
VHAATGPATSSPAISCAQVTSLRNSLTTLRHTAATLASAGPLSTDLGNLDRQLVALKGKVGKAFSAQVSQLSDDLSQITKDAGTLLLHPSSANVTDLTRAVRRLKAASEPMIKEVKEIRTSCAAG